MTAQKRRERDAHDTIVSARVGEEMTKASFCRQPCDRPRQTVLLIAKHRMERGKQKRGLGERRHLTTVPVDGPR